MRLFACKAYCSTSRNRTAQPVYKHLFPLPCSIFPYLIRRNPMTQRNVLIEKIRMLPTQIEQLTANLTPEQLTTPYLQGEWTVAQNVHHLPDSHMNSYIRCKLIATEDTHHSSRTSRISGRCSLTRRMPTFRHHLRCCTVCMRVGSHSGRVCPRRLGHAQECTRSTARSPSPTSCRCTQITAKRTSTRLPARRRLKVRSVTRFHWPQRAQRPQSMKRNEHRSPILSHGF